MRKVTLLILSLIAVHAVARIARRSQDLQGVPGFAELTWLLVYVLTAPAITKNTPKTNATKARVDNLVAAVGATNTAVTATSTAVAATTTRVNNLSGQQTGTASVGTTSTADGSPVTSGPSDTGIFNTGGQVGGAAAHYHPLPNFPEADHTHDFAGHVHDFGGHTHSLPSV
jgi:hypothetical protein